MLRALNTAATGMSAQQTRIDVTANNMANVNTTGFRRSRAEFQDLMYQTMRAPGGTGADGAPLPTGIQIGQGTRTVATQTIFTQGSMTQTGGPLDLAIEGDGFLQVQRGPGQLAYTRAGNLKTNAEGQLVTVDGFAVEPAIHIPPEAAHVTITQNGIVSAVLSGQSTAVEIGRIQLAHFANPTGLEALGRGLFVPTGASGEPIVGFPGDEGIGTVAQGFLEGSNVEVVNEMIDLITSQRAYEVNQRVIQAADEMLRKTTER